MPIFLEPCSRFKFATFVAKNSGRHFVVLWSRLATVFDKKWRASQKRHQVEYYFFSGMAGLIALPCKLSNAPHPLTILQLLIMFIGQQKCMKRQCLGNWGKTPPRILGVSEPNE